MGNQHVFLLHPTSSPPLPSSSNGSGSKRWWCQSSLLIFIFIIYTPLVINSIHAAQLETDERQQQQHQHQQQSPVSSTVSSSQSTPVTSSPGPCESTVLERIPADPVSEITFSMIWPRYAYWLFPVAFRLFRLSICRLASSIMFFQTQRYVSCQIRHQTSDINVTHFVFLFSQLHSQRYPHKFTLIPTWNI